MARILVLLAALLVSLAARADEATIRHVVEAQFGLRVVAVHPSPVAGVYEVDLRGSDGVAHVVYSDAGAEHIFVNGSLIDTGSDRNLTQERLRKLNAIDFKSLPLDLAIKIKRGDGRRVLAMFADPHCPACEQFERQLAQVGDITIYVFMYPVIHPELIAQSRAVWCSPDRAKAWNALALHGRLPRAKPTCATPIDKILALGRRLQIWVTPTLFLADGERIEGGMSATDLRAMLDKVALDEAAK